MSKYKISTPAHWGEIPQGYSKISNPYGSKYYNLVFRHGNCLMFTYWELFNEKKSIGYRKIISDYRMVESSKDEMKVEIMKKNSKLGELL